MVRASIGLGVCWVVEGVSGVEDRVVSVHDDLSGVGEVEEEVARGQREGRKGGEESDRLAMAAGLRLAWLGWLGLAGCNCCTHTFINSGAPERWSG